MTALVLQTGKLTECYLLICRMKFLYLQICECSQPWISHYMVYVERCCFHISFHMTIIRDVNSLNNILRNVGYPEHILFNEHNSNTFLHFPNLLTLNTCIEKKKRHCFQQKNFFYIQHEQFEGQMAVNKRFVAICHYFMYDSHIRVCF